MRVIVYKNLVRGNWSIATPSGRDGRGRGKVIDHASSVILTNVQFVVQESGRQRVLNKRQREVHAWVVGDIVDSIPANATPLPITYNPYRCGAFTTRDGAPIDGAAHVEFTSDRGAIAYGSN